MSPMTANPSQPRDKVTFLVTRRRDSSPIVARRAAVLAGCPRARMARPLHYPFDVRNRGLHRAFTLVELMIVVVIIGILAAVAIPQFTKATRKARSSEVNAVFAELRQRQEEYHLANGVYFSTGTSETDLYPASPGRTAQLATTPPTSWTTLKVSLKNSKLFCGYVAIAGTAGSAVGLGTKAGDFGLTAAPTTDWYYLVARCNLDGNTARDGYYFTWSGDTAVRKENEGS